MIAGKTKIGVQKKLKLKIGMNKLGKSSLAIKTYLSNDQMRKGRSLNDKMILCLTQFQFTEFMDLANLYPTIVNEVRDSQNQSLLHYSVQSSRPDIVELIIAKGTPLDHQDVR